jgi:hypothetical protein
MAEKDWISKAVSNHKGAFKARAEKAHALDKEGNIKESFIEKSERSTNPVIEKEAVLAATLRRLHK